MPWKPLDRIAFAICTYPFTPQLPQDLPLQIGDELYIIEQGGKHGEWYRGYLVAPPSLLAGLTSTKGQPLEARVFSGIFPRDCVDIRELLGDVVSPLAQQPGLANGDVPHAADTDTPCPKRKPAAPVPMLKIGDETALAKEEPLVDEIASCLREWHNTNLHELLLSRDYDAVDRLITIVRRLDLSRRKLLHKLLTKKELAELRESAVWDLVTANKMLGQDIVVRSTAQKGAILTATDSAVEISNLQSAMSLLDQQPPAAAESKALRHLLINLSHHVPIEDKTTAYAFCLFSKIGDEEATLISEVFSVDANADRAPMDLSTSTLFTDISPTEVDDSLKVNAKLYLVVKMITNESPRARPADPAPTTNGGGNPETDGGPFRGLRSPRRSVMWNQMGSRFGRPGTSNSAQSTENVDSPMAVYKAPDKPVKRTTGVGILDVTAVFASTEPVRHEIAIRSRVLEPVEEKSLDKILDWLIPEVHGDKYTHAFHTTTRILVHLRAFSNPDSGELIQSTPSLLHGIQPTRRIGFARAPTKMRSDIYFTLLSPHIPKGALISHPKYGSEAISPEIGTENYQLTMEVRNMSGERIDHCIFPNSTSNGHTAWRTTAVARGEYWNQTIRLSLDPQDVPGCHVIMSVADGFGFPFALAYIPLWNQEAFARDGHHSLILYKYDEHTANSGPGRGGYMGLPWQAKMQDEAVTGPVACLNVNTFLCSTKYSQDPNLLALLKWKDQGPGSILDVLTRFTMVPDIEIVKLLEDVLDAIFGVIVEYSGNDEIEEQAFSALVMTLNVVHDRRFNVQPMVDDYVNTKFVYPFAFPCLVRSFTRLLSAPTEPDTARRLRAACKLGSHILKFIVRARQQQIQKERGIGLTDHDVSYLHDFKGIFQGVDTLIKHTEPVVLGTKTILAQHFHSWLIEVAPCLTEQEVLTIATSFVNALGSAQGKLVLYKLLLIYNISKANLFHDMENQERWLALVVDSIDPHWGRVAGTWAQFRDQVRLCCSIVAIDPSHYVRRSPEIVQKLVQSFRTMKIHPRPKTETFSPLFPDTYPFQQRPIQTDEHFDEALIEIAALLAVMTTKYADSLVDAPHEQLSRLLLEGMEVQQAVLAGEAFPASWLSLRIYHYSAILQALHSFFTTMVLKFLPDADDADKFDSGLWKAFLQSILQLVGSDALVIENFSEQRRRAVWKIGGDLRESGAQLLGKAWTALGWTAPEAEKQMLGLDKFGGFQVSFAVDLVGPVVELCLSVHESLRCAATDMLHSMIASEWSMSEDLEALQTKTIEAINDMFKARDVTDGMVQRAFVNDLRKRLRLPAEAESDKFHIAAHKLLNTIDHLLELLIPVHSTDTNRDNFPVMDALRLMEFFKSVNKEDIFIHYVHRLASLQEREAHHTEAGLAIRMHAELYSWSTDKMVPAVEDLQMPRQSMFERREALYFRMIGLFEEGLAFRQALLAYQELAAQYETVLFDFSKLSRAQRAMATINERILRGEQIAPRYFRVIFKGLGFPTTLRDRHFIFEGEPDDRQSTFIDRMQKHYPAAQISSGTPTGDYEGQFISVHTVSAQKNLLHPINRRLRIAPAIREHYMLAEPQHFTTTSRRQASTTTVKDQVMEKIIFTTAEAFPNVLGRSEIVRLESVKISPMLIGLERTIRKTNEIRVLHARVMEGDEEALVSLIDELKILVGRRSSGNVSGYWALLTKPDGKEAHASEPLYAPCADSVQEALRTAMVDHVLAIRSCIEQFPTGYATDQSLLRREFESSFVGPMATARDALPAAFDHTPLPKPVIHGATALSSPSSNEPSALPPVRAGSSATNHTTALDSDDDASIATAEEKDKASSRFARGLTMLNFQGAEPKAAAPSETGTTGAASASMRSQLNGVLQSRVGSVTKRFSTLTFGRKGRAAGMLSPKPSTISEAEGP